MDFLIIVHVSSRLIMDLNSQDIGVGAPKHLLIYQLPDISRAFSD